MERELVFAFSGTNKEFKELIENLKHSFHPETKIGEVYWYLKKWANQELPSFRNLYEN